MQRTIYICATLIIILNAIIIAQSNSVLFRFNANHDFSQNISSSVEVYNVEFQKYLDSVEATARNVGGWGYYAPIYSVFSENNSYLESTEKVRVSFAGDHMLSGEVWFKTDSENGSIFSWNDSTQSHGLDLYLSNSKLNLERRLKDTTLVLTSSTNFELKKWYHVIWTLDVSKADVKLEFYINNYLDISKVFTLNSDVGFAIVNSLVLIGKSDYKTELLNFNGILSAVNFKSYIPQEEYLNTNFPFDGSEYLGIPTYHNYNIGTRNEEVDQIISSTPTPIMESAIVPYMDDNFIPQGLTNSYEDNENFYPTPMVYSSLYNKTVTGITGEKASIIVEMDPNNNFNIRRCFQLNGYLKFRHNGGLAFFNNKIYVASGSRIEVYDVPKYDSLNRNKYVSIYPGSGNLYTVNSISSFITYYNDSVWVGDYVENSNNGYIKGYPLDENGKVINTVVPKKYKIPNRTQGVAWINVEGTEYLMISLSSGNGYSSIYRVNRSELNSSTAPTPEKVFLFPAGGEDLSFDKDKNLYAQSESGSKYFQKRTSSPWSTFYPFIYKISYETLFNDIVSVEDDYGIKQDNSSDEISLTSYPNPTNNMVNIIFNIQNQSKIVLRVVNIIGETVKKWEKLNASGKYHISWDVNGIASGIYFLQLVSSKKIYSHKVLIMK